MFLCKYILQKNKVPCIYIVLAVIGVLLLIFIVIVAWKLVSLEDALAEERQARANENENIRLLFETPLNGSNPIHSKLCTRQINQSVIVASFFSKLRHSFQ